MSAWSSGQLTWFSVWPSDECICDKHTPQLGYTFMHVSFEAPYGSVWPACPKDIAAFCTNHFYLDRSLDICVLDLDHDLGRDRACTSCKAQVASASLFEKTSSVSSY